MTTPDPLAEWIDHLPGVTSAFGVTFGELMVPVSAVRQHFRAASSQPEPLDAAWKAAEAALPEGTRLRVELVRFEEGRWRAIADMDLIDRVGEDAVSAFGHTPAAALLALLPTSETPPMPNSPTDECAEVCTSSCHADDCEHHAALASQPDRGPASAKSL